MASFQPSGNGVLGAEEVGTLEEEEEEEEEDEDEEEEEEGLGVLLSSATAGTAVRQ